MALRNMTNRRGSWVSSPFKSPAPGKAYSKGKDKSRRPTQNIFTPPAADKTTTIRAFDFDDVVSPAKENAFGKRSLKKPRGHRRSGLTPQKRSAPHISPPKNIAFSSDEEEDDFIVPVARATKKGGRGSKAATGRSSHAKAASTARRRMSRAEGKEGKEADECKVERPAAEGVVESKRAYSAEAKTDFRSPRTERRKERAGPRTPAEEIRHEHFNRLRAAEVSPAATRPRKKKLGGLAKYYIVRDRSGMKRMFPNFSLYRENEDGHVPQLVMIAKRQRACRSVNYHLYSVDGGVPAKSLSKDSDEYLGKIRADGSTSTEFTLYGREGPDTDDVRPQLAAIKFVSTGDYTRPRQLQVLLPPPTAAGAATVWTKQSPTEALLHRLNTQRCDGLLYVQSKLPVIVGDAYRLDFEGRVKVASIKNSQLEYIPDSVDKGHPHKVLQFGKVEDDRFVLDFCEPLSPMQAFAYGIVQFVA